MKCSIPHKLLADARWPNIATGEQRKEFTPGLSLRHQASVSRGSEEPIVVAVDSLGAAWELAILEIELTSCSEDADLVAERREHDAEALALQFNLQLFERGTIPVSRERRHTARDSSSTRMIGSRSRGRFRPISHLHRATLLP